MRKEGVTVEVERAMGMDQEEGAGERESGGARFDDDVPIKSASDAVARRRPAT